MSSYHASHVLYSVVVLLALSALGRPALLPPSKELDRRGPLPASLPPLSPASAAGFRPASSAASPSGSGSQLGSPSGSQSGSQSGSPLESPRTPGSRPQLVYQGGAAIVYADIKMDDKGAISLLLAAYERVFVNIVGVQNRKAAAYDLGEFIKDMAEMHRQQPGLAETFSMDRVVMTEGTNVLHEAVDHEKLWVKAPQWEGTLPSLDGVMDEINRFDRVDMYQIAPTGREQFIRHVGKIGKGKIKRYMQLAGYNSRQVNTAKASAVWSKIELEAQQAIQSLIRANNKFAKAVFLSNSDSYSADVDGSSQTYDWMQRRFPKRHLDMAVGDPFWTTMFEVVSSRASHATAQLQAMMRKHGVDLYGAMLIARSQRDATHPDRYSAAALELRAVFRHMIEEAKNDSGFQREDPKRYGRLSTLFAREFRDGATVNPSIEMGDANAVAALLTRPPLGAAKRIRWAMGRQTSGYIHAPTMVPADDADGDLRRAPADPDFHRELEVPADAQGWLWGGLRISRTAEMVDSILGFKGMGGQMVSRGH